MSKTKKPPVSNSPPKPKKSLKRRRPSPDQMDSVPVFYEGRKVGRRWA